MGIPRRSVKGACPPAGCNEHPITNSCRAAYAARRRHLPTAHQPSARPAIAASISEGITQELPLAKKSPGVANAQPIQPSVIKENAQPIAVRNRIETSRRVTSSRLIRLSALRKDDECDGDISPIENKHRSKIARCRFQFLSYFGSSICGLLDFTKSVLSTNF
jgi:hypothetical protein